MGFSLKRLETKHWINIGWFTAGLFLTAFSPVLGVLFIVGPLYYREYFKNDRWVRV